jgi:hypothetical protein
MVLVYRGELGTIGRGLLPLLDLRRNRGYTLLVQHRDLCSRGSGIEPTGTVIADSAGVVGNSIVINVVNNRGIHIVNRAVVVEHIPVPISALITMAHITVAVIDAAIVADMRAPVSTVPAIATAAEGPVRRRPKRADIGSNHPCAWHPIITFGRIRPVTGCPYIIVAGAFGLAVFGERRRWLFRLNWLLTICGVFRVV